MNGHFQSVSEKIEEIIRVSLNPVFLEVIDDSARHEGHAGHNGKGESHFKLMVVSQGFMGLSRIKRHQLVYEMLNELLKTRIHALQITALTPHEYS